MLSLEQSIYPELAELGSCRQVKGVLNEDTFVSGHTEYGIKDNIYYDVLLSNTGEAILVSGTVGVCLQTECARCLEPAEIELECEVEGYFLLEEAEEVEGYEEDEFECIGEDGTFDIGSCIEAAIAAEIPFTVYCQDDCLGLCPHCGGNLNLNECNCEGTYVDPTNPFAALANLTFDDNEK